MTGGGKGVKPVALSRGEGRKLRESPTGARATLKVGADETTRGMSIFESLRPAGDLGGPVAHHHPFDEAFYVLEGEYVFSVEGRETAASVGSFLYVPGGSLHAFRHAGEGAGRMLTICHPGGLEEFLAASTPEEIEAMAKKHGIEFVGPPPVAG
jgi:mannose-6-phosphate isomerase-like protein (cupin superfamily)